MAWTNALNNVISDMFVSGPVEQSKLPFIANTQWSDVAESSNQVTIITVASATTGTYTPGSDITIGTGGATNAILTCDQLDYFADEMDDSVKMVGQYAVAYGQKALQELALKSDKYVLSLATKANFPTNWYAGVSDAAVDVNGANILAVLEELTVNLDEENVPYDNRFIVVPPSLAAKIRLGAKKAAISVERSGDILFNGKVDKIGGFNILISNQYTAITGAYKCLYGHPDCIAAANKLPAIESFRPEKRFSTAIKALFRHGAKVINEKVGGAAYLKPVAET